MNKDIEHEGKILDIDVASFKKKLSELGAISNGEILFRRYVFDTIPQTPNRWVRLRSDGKTTTLTVKEIASDAIDGTMEWEVEVSDIDTTLKILEKIGIKPRGYQENKREDYTFGDASISIDYWPKLNPYVEIEAKDSFEVERTAQALGYSTEELTGLNTEALYAQIDIDLKKTATLTFNED